MNTESSSIESSKIVFKTGESLTGFTSKTKLSESVNSPSLTVYVTIILPLKLRFGIIVNKESEIFETAFPLTNALNSNTSSSISLAFNTIVKISSSLTLCVLISTKTGASFTGVTSILIVAVFE